MEEIQEEEKKVYTVTEKQVDEAIIGEEYHKLGNKTTICFMVLNTGFEVVGSSAPVDPDNFDFSMGKKYARQRAVEKVWEHLGSIVQYQKALDEHLQRVAAQEAAPPVVKEEK